MNEKVLESLDRKLRRQRETLFKGVADTEIDLQVIAEHRESEIEERAWEDRTSRLLARLDERGKRSIEEIDAALQRIKEGTYGTCVRCGRKISVARLKAIPVTRLCVACARAEERGEPPLAAAVEEPEERPRQGPVPPDFVLMHDREIEEVLRERVRTDERIDSEELRIVCRHGVVYVDGALPSEGEHQMLRQVIEDVEGFREVVDRIQVKELLWEREDRSKEQPPEERTPWSEERGTDDVVKSVEEGLEYEPPDEPIPEEE